LPLQQQQLWQFRCSGLVLVNVDVALTVVEAAAAAAPAVAVVKEATGVSKCHRPFAFPAVMQLL
jgi:hypothetical protein